MQSVNQRDNERSSKSVYQRAEEQFKKVLFNILFRILKQDEPSIYVNNLFQLTICLQIVYFNFHNTVKDSWNHSSITDPLNKYLGYLHVVQLFEGSSWGNFLLIFYVIVGLIVFSLLVSIIIGYSMRSQKGSSIFNSLLRKFYFLLSTVAYMPCLQIMAAVFSCKEITNSVTETNLSASTVYKNILFPSETCWSGLHIVHAIIAMFFFLLTFAIVSVVTLTFFEIRVSNQDQLARVTGRYHLLYIIYQTINVLLYATLNSSGNKLVLVFLNCFGASFVHYKFRTDSPFYHQVTITFWDVLTGICWWSSVFLLFAFLFEEIVFKGLLSIWIASTPIVIIILAFNLYDKSYIIRWHPQLLNNEKMVIDYANYLQFLYRYQNEYNFRMQLENFLIMHMKLCLHPHCYIKLVMDKNRKNKRISFGGQFLRGSDIEDWSWKNKLESFGLAYQVFYNGIKQFQESVAIRIHFAFFLLTNTKFKQQSLQEIMLAQKMIKPFDYDFVIYRYKRLIEDDISENQNEDLLDIVSQLAFQNNLRIFQSVVEQTSLLHMQFWSQLRQDVPDLGQLFEIGISINHSYASVQEKWQRLRQMSGNSSNTNLAYTLYGNYLLDIINDAKAGGEMLQIAKDIQTSNQSKLNQVYTNIEDINTQSYATLILSSQEEQIGQIVAVNLSACNLFGYTQQELIGRNIKILMPNVIGQNHDRFLLDYLNAQESAYMKRERGVLGLSQTNYVFPAYIRIRTMQTGADQGLQFVGSFRIEKYFRKIGYVLTDTEGFIQHCTANFISLYNLDYQWISKKSQKRHLDMILPGLFDEKMKFLETQANGGEQQIHRDLFIIQDPFKQESYQQFHDINNRHDEIDDLNSQHHQHMNQNEIPKNLHAAEQVLVSISELKPLGIYSVGWVFKIQLDQQKGMDLLNLSNISHNNINNNNPAAYNEKNKGNTYKLGRNFQFNFNNATKCFNGGFSGKVLNSEVNSIAESAVPSNHQTLNGGGKSNNDLLQKINEQDRDRINLSAQIFQKNKHLTPQQPVDKKQSYQDGIRTYRLLNDGQLSDVDQDRNSEEDQSENGSEEQKVVQEPMEEENQDDEPGFNILQSKKAVQAVIKDTREAKSVSRIKFAMNFLFISMLIVIFVDYFLSFLDLVKLSEFLALTKSSAQRSSELAQILGKVRDLRLINMGVYPNVLQTLNWAGDIEFENQRSIFDLNAGIKEHLIFLQQVQRNLSLSNVKITELDNRKNYYNQVQIYFSQDRVSNFDLKESTEQMVNYAFKITSMDVSNIVPEDNSYFFVHQNMFNQYFSQVRQACLDYVETFQTYSIQMEKLILDLLISGVVFDFLCFLGQIVCIIVLMNNLENILRLFLDVPKKTIKYLHTKCEIFITNLQMGQDENRESFDNLDYLALQDESDGTSYVKKKHKQFKNQMKSFKSVCAVLSLTFMAIFAYFILIYLLTENTLIFSQNLIREETFLTTSNIQRQILMDRNWSIFTQNPSKAFSDQLQSVTELNVLIQSSFADNFGTHEDSFKSLFSAIMNSPDSCQKFYPQLSTSQESCNQFSNGLVQNGFSLVLSRYIDFIQNINTLYERILKEPDGEFSKLRIEGATLLNIFPDNQLDNKVISLLTSQMAMDIRTIETELIPKGFDLIREGQSHEINKILDEIYLIKLIMFILVIVCFFFGYTIIWLPFISNQSRDLNRTRSMLSIIPISAIVHIQNVRNFLKNYMANNDFSDY